MHFGARGGVGGRQGSQRSGMHVSVCMCSACVLCFVLARWRMSSRLRVCVQLTCHACLPCTVVVETLRGKTITCPCTQGSEFHLKINRCSACSGRKPLLPLSQRQHIVQRLLVVDGDCCCCISAVWRSSDHQHHHYHFYGIIIYGYRQSRRPNYSSPSELV